MILKFYDAFDQEFILPSDKDYTYVVQIASMKKAEEKNIYERNFNQASNPDFNRLRILEQLNNRPMKHIELLNYRLRRILEDSDTVKNTTVSLSSIYHPDNNTLTSFTPVPKEFRHLEYLDLQVETNGFQYFTDLASGDSYAINHEPKHITVINNKVELPGNPYESNNKFVLMIKDAARGVATATDGLSLLGMGTAGSSGAMVMRFTQILKVYNRLKYIGVEFGVNLDAYLTAIGEIFTDSQKDLVKISRQRILEKGWKGKLSRYRVFVNFEENLGWKLYAYISICLIAIIMNHVLTGMINSQYQELSTKRYTSWEEKKKIFKPMVLKVRILTLIRYLRFVLFNMVAVDGSFFASRIIVHTFNEGNFSDSSWMKNYILAILLMALMCLDFVNLMDSGFSLSKKGHSFHQDEIQKRNKNIQDKVIDSNSSKMFAKKKKLNESEMGLNRSSNENITLDEAADSPQNG